MVKDITKKNYVSNISRTTYVAQHNEGCDGRTRRAATVAGTARPTLSCPARCLLDGKHRRGPRGGGAPAWLRRHNKARWQALGCNRWALPCRRARPRCCLVSSAAAWNDGTQRHPPDFRCLRGSKTDRRGEAGGARPPAPPPGPPSVPTGGWVIMGLPKILLYPQPEGMGLPKIPCCPSAGAWPPPEISPGALSPGTEPSTLEVLDGKMERPEQCSRSRFMLSKHQ